MLITIDVREVQRFGTIEVRQHPDLAAQTVLFHANLVMADQFQSMGGVLAVLDGPKGSTLITERNKVALAVLKAQLDAGAKKVAIFYGAGHMPDMAKRLEDDFRMQRKSTRWLRAWDLRGEKSKSDAAAQDEKSAGAKIDQ